MNFLFAINHPSQFHMFKNLAIKLIEDNHNCIFFIQQRGIIEDLVIDQGFEYRFLVSPIWRDRLKGRFGIILRGIIHIIQSDVRVLLYSLQNQVDMLLGTDVSITHVGFLLKKVSIVFTDDDFYFIKQYCNLAFPFANHVFAASVVDVGKWEKKRIGYGGNQKTGYLHPQYFKPDPRVLEKYGLCENEYSIIRLVTFAAIHDSVHSVQSGLNASILNQIIPFLKGIGRVIINKEQNDNSGFEEYQVQIDPEDMHSLMYYARLLLTDSQSMHVEAGLLGTPSIRTNQWVDKEKRLHVIDYLENNYGLGISVSPNAPELIISKTKELAGAEMKELWNSRREDFFRENTNFTELLFWFVSQYPNSYKAYVGNPSIIDRFR